MPDAVRLEVPDWLLPRLAARFGPALEAELHALLRPGAARPARQPAEGHPRGSPGGAGRRGPATPTPTRSRPGACASPAAARSPPAPPSSPAWWRSRTRAASSSPPWWTRAPAMRVCDFCAGAGGKTLALAATMANRGQIARLRHLRRPAGQRRPPSAPRRRIGNVERHLLLPGDKWAKRRAGTLRSRAGGCALHRHRHLAPQPRCAATPDREPTLPN